ncbi:MAG: BLUF domain-containing protein [Rhodospirillaceae bacterium]|nr:BLUF domain-containing protein [Rhodospirillaceae bacterium]
MSLYRLAYASVASKPLSKADLKQILSASVRRNQAESITGALCFSRDAFVQVLEGARPRLSTSFRRISSDTRHKDVELIGLEPIRARVFGNWSMAFIDDSKEVRDIIFRHCGADRLVADALDLSGVTNLVRAMLGQPNEQG